MYKNKEKKCCAACHDHTNAVAWKQRKPQILEQMGREGSRRTLGARSPQSPWCIWVCSELSAGGRQHVQKVEEHGCKPRPTQDTGMK